MLLFLVLSQVIVSPPPRMTATTCRMSVASCARLTQLRGEDNEYIGPNDIQTQDYVPEEYYVLRAMHAPSQWGEYATERK